MGLDNDTVFNELFEEQYDKIPKIFRLNRKISKIAIIIIVVFIAGASIFLNLWYNSGEYITTPSVGGYEMGFNVYNNSYMVGMIICLLIVILIAGWLTIGVIYERRAFKKASYLSNMIFLSERHRDEVRRQNNNLLKRY